MTRASTIAMRYDLPMSLAFRIADGAMTVEAARRARSEGAPNLVLPGPRGRRREGRARVWLVPVSIGLVVGGLLAAVGSQQEPAGSPVATPSVRAAMPTVEPAVDSQEPMVFESTDDGEGRITRISARSSRAVLEAYCTGGRSREPCEPVGIRSTRPHRAGVKLGVLRTARDFGREYAIWIRHDPQAGGWFAGNGLQPLRAEPLAR